LSFALSSTADIFFFQLRALFLSLPTVAFIQFFNLLEGSGIKKATTRAISKRLNSLHNGFGFGFSTAYAFAVHPDAHTSSLAGKSEIIYADYAGAPPYSISAVKAATEELLNGVWGNPHSDHDWQTTATASSSSAAGDRLRQLTLDMCQGNSNAYVCILTSGATAALKLVAETFPWSEEENKDGGGDGGGGSGSQFRYLSDNHNSVLGIREIAAAHGAHTQCVHPSDIKIINTSPEKESNRIEKAPMQKSEFEVETQHLFAFPLESNFSGTRYSENLVLAIQNQNIEITTTASTTTRPPMQINSSSAASGCDVKTKGKWRVLLDAAKSCATNPPNLSLYPADFVALSYYKIFGYPTGLGALIVKRDALSMLRKTYFGGGTVLSSSAEDRFHAFRPGYAGFEDGTLPFLAFPAVLQSFSAWHHRGGFPAALKVANTAAYRFAGKLLALKHSNGCSVATVYGQWNNCTIDNNEIHDESLFNNNSITSGQGPTITFNLLDPRGNWVGHRQVQRIASLEGIYLRTGVMCNPGACSIATGVQAVQAKAWFENGHACWDDKDVLDGIPTGAVRVSFGWGSTLRDADALVEFVTRHFVFTKTEEEEEEEEEKEAAVPETDIISIENGKASEVDFETEPEKHDDVRIHSLTIYPIKSAAGFSPRSWPVSPASGLLYDRHWAVVDSRGSVLTLKKCPQLSRLHPVVDLDDNVLRIHAKGMKDVLEIPLPDVIAQKKITGASLDLPGSSISSISCSRNSIEWLIEALGIPCSLIEYTQHYTQDFDSSTTVDVANSENKHVGKSKDFKNHHGFSNEAQVLLVTLSSLQAIFKSSGIESSFEKFTTRFRPNIIVEEKYVPSLLSENEEEIMKSCSDDCGEDEKQQQQIAHKISSAHDSLVENNNTIIEKEDELRAFEEEQWTTIRFTNPAACAGGVPTDRAMEITTDDSPVNSQICDDRINFEVLGPCPRCEIVCIDPTTGMRQGPEPLLTLAKERKGAGKKRFCFGVLLNAKQSDDGNGADKQIKENTWTRVAVGMHVTYETKSVWKKNSKNRKK